MMEVFKDIIPLRDYLEQHKKSGKTIGLVPTMGALHDGHLSLLNHSIEECDVTVCSIYVNPTQFNNSSDLEKYPRSLENDLKLLEGAGCQAVFVPSDEVMYPQPAEMAVNFGAIEKVMEGAFRPGHFNGVAIVVSKLFNIINPHKAYFGQKDLQQFLIIKKLLSSLSFPIELRRIPTVREADGLAKSSRNLRLSPEARNKSVILHRALKTAEEMLLQNPFDLEVIKQKAREMITSAGFDVEYFEIADEENLSPISNISDRINVAICVAASIEDVRLIDNLILSLNS